MRRDAGAIVLAAKGLAILRIKAKKAQDSEIVLGDAPIRISNEADNAQARILYATSCGIMKPPVPIHIDRIHREIAPVGINAPIPPEGDLSMTTISPPHRHAGS